MGDWINLGMMYTTLILSVLFTVGSVDVYIPGPQLIISTGKRKTIVIGIHQPYKNIAE